MARYKYSENPNEVTDIYFDTETHGEYMGMEQDGVMKAVPLPMLQEKIVEEVSGDLSAHVADTANPHSVTKTQVGLSNVDNTSDVNKPISTLQQEALDMKESVANVDILKGTGWAGETVKGNADAIDILNADDTTEGSVAKSIKDAVDPIIEDVSDHETRLDTLESDSAAIVLKDIKDNAKDATYDNSTSGLTAETLGGAIDEVEGRVDTAEGEIDELQTAETAIKGTGWTDENLVDHESRLDTLESDDTTEGSVLKSIKDNAEDATYDNTDSGLTASTIKTAIDEVEGRVDTVEGEIDELQTAETAIKGNGWTDENLVDHEDRLDTLEADSATEGSVAKSIKDAVDPIIEDVSDHEIRIEVLEGVTPLTSWDGIQKVAKAGFASRYLKVGDLIETTYNGSPAVVELIGINHPFDIPPAGVEYGDVLSFQFKDSLRNVGYSTPQALFNAVEGLSAGTYTFVNSDNSLPYTFTLNEAIPVGGVIFITSWGGTYEPLVIETMQADRRTNIETGIAVTQAPGGTALAPVNFTPRCRYGSNLYIESNVRHFLNDSSDSYVWVAQGLYDMPSTYGAGGGFLKRLDADFASVIGPVVKKVARANADGGGQDTIEDKVWLLSRVEMGYGTEGVATGEQVYERWNEAANAERIKLVSGSPRDWWLRSPDVSNQYFARGVRTNGTLGYYYSGGSYLIGLAPGLAVY